MSTLEAGTPSHMATIADDHYARQLSPELPIDPGIVRAVRLLRSEGVETFESCEGSEGHAFFEPTVRFFGGRYAGWHALSVAQTYGLPVSDLRRYWYIDDGEPCGPYWEIVFSEKPLAPLPG